MKRVALGALALLACTRTTHLIEPLAADGGANEDASVLPIPDAAPVLCGDALCACSNGVDDDGDDLRDGFDPECTSPADDFEDSFATGAHGEDQQNKCQDCFFDDNSGTGGDCSRARSCAIDGTPNSGNGACRRCEVSGACQQHCLPRVPNGCDCFGCCDVWREGARVKSVLLDATCSLAGIDEPSKCTPCAPAADCFNPCGECELCTGRTLADLPASCAGSGPGFVCDAQPTCSAEVPCAGLAYCQQGCCLPQGI